MLEGISRIVRLHPVDAAGEPRLLYAEVWLPRNAGAIKHQVTDANQLASIVYTSGTTCKPKGVMLSHANMLKNAAALSTLPVYVDDVSISFLPLSHALERTCGYYLTLMAGSTVAFVHSITLLA